MSAGNPRKINPRSGWSSSSSRREKARSWVEGLENRRLLSAAPSINAGAGQFSSPSVVLPPTGVAVGSVSGTVVDAGGAGIAGATVVLDRIQVDPIQPLTSASASGSLAIFGSYYAQTDANGNFNLSEVAAGNYTATAYKTGLANNSSAVFTVSASANTAVPAITLAPVQNGTVSGSVTDAAGAAVAGATVTLLGQDDLPHPIPLALANVFPIGGPALTAQTDSQGNYSFTKVPVGSYTATAAKEGFSSADSSVVTVAANANTVVPAIALGAIEVDQGSVSGRVVDSNGSAVVGATVIVSHGFIHPPLPEASARGTVIPVDFGQTFTAQTDQNGNYSVTAVPVGTYTATASADGLVASSASFTVTKNANAVVPTLTLAATQQGSVSGTVTDSGGNPLSGATVFIAPPIFSGGESSTGDDGNPLFLPLGFFTAHTDATGAYTVSNVPPGTYTATASQAGFARATSSSFSVTAGANTPAPALALTAIKTGSVSGSVVDAKGVGIAGASVTISIGLVAQPQASGASLPIFIPVDPPITVQTDPNGNYTADKVPVGNNYVATAFKSGYQFGASAPFSVTDGNNTAAPPLTLSPGDAFCDVSGVVNEEGGTAPADTLVEIAPAASATAPPATRQHPLFVHTSATGSYDFKKVAPGNYTVSILNKSRHPIATSTATVTSGSTKVSPITVAAPTSNGPVIGNFSGSVTGAGGNGVNRARVVLTPVSATTTGKSGRVRLRKLAALTGKTGIYSFKKIPAASYTLTVTAKNYQKSAPVIVNVAAGANAGPTVQLLLATAPRIA